MTGLYFDARFDECLMALLLLRRLLPLALEYNAGEGRVSAGRGNANSWDERRRAARAAYGLSEGSSGTA